MKVEYVTSDEELASSAARTIACAALVWLIFATSLSLYVMLKRPVIIRVRAKKTD
jgi:hypothetical protein